MNRRAFIVFSTGLISWAVVGKMGYKEEAPLNMQKLGKKCDTCGWYANGFCKFPGIMKNVKPNGICNMWKKS